MSGKAKNYARFILVLSISFPAFAVQMNVAERQFTHSPDNLRTWKLPEVLSQDEQGRPTFDFQEATGDNSKLVDLLEYGMDIRVPNIQRQLATEVQKLSQYCNMDQLKLNVVISPVPRLSNEQVGVKDPRRITTFVVANCLKPVPAECRYSIDDNNDTGMGFMDLRRFLELCQGKIAEIFQDQTELGHYQNLNDPNRGSQGKIRKSR